MEATNLMTTGDRLFGEVTIEDTDAAATGTANEWQGRRFGRTDHGSRMAPSAAQSHGTTHAWTGVRVHMGKNQEICGAELHTIYCDMLTLFQEPPRPDYHHLRKCPGSLTEDYIRRTMPRTAIRSHDRTTGTRPMGATKSLRPVPMGPQPCRYRWQREGRRVGKDSSTERIPQSNCLTSSATRTSPLEAERKWVEDGVAL